MKPAVGRTGGVLVSDSVRGEAARPPALAEVGRSHDFCGASLPDVAGALGSSAGAPGRRVALRWLEIPALSTEKGAWARSLLRDEMEAQGRTRP